MGVGARARQFGLPGLLALGLGVACSGRSMNRADDEGSGGDAQGATGGTSVGGTGGVGGTTDGGTIAVGGSPATGGTAGTISVGGAPNVCPVCPDADYGLVIEGDGATYDIDYNGTIASAADWAPPLCPEQPLTGAVGGCTRSITFQGCEGPMSGPPCLEVTQITARYLDLTGKLWLGNLVSDVPATAQQAGVASGVATLQFADDAGGMLTLRVTYTLCAALGNLRIPC